MHKRASGKRGVTTLTHRPVKNTGPVGATKITTTGILTARGYLLDPKTKKTRYFVSMTDDQFHGRKWGALYTITGHITRPEAKPPLTIQAVDVTPA